MSGDYLYSHLLAGSYAMLIRPFITQGTAQASRNRVLGAGLFVCLLFVLAGCVSAKHRPTHNQILVSQFEQGGVIAKETPRGVVIYLPSVMFVSGSAQLSGDASDKVAYIAKVSNDKIARKRNVLIEGHTDSIGSAEENMMLSKNRVTSVLDVLLRFEMAPERVDTAWFGESQPLLPNQHSDGSDDPQARAANRRVEFILLNP